MATLAHGGVRSTERGLLETIVTLPASLRDSLTAAVQLVAVVLPAAVVVALAVRRRFAAVGKLVVAGAIGTVGRRAGLAPGAGRLSPSHLARAVDGTERDRGGHRPAGGVAGRNDGRRDRGRGGVVAALAAGVVVADRYRRRSWR